MLADFAAMGLSANLSHLPVQLSQLVQLQHLVLLPANAGGTFPTEYAQLSQLQTLRLACSGCMGGFPALYSQLPELHVLEVVGGPGIDGKSGVQTIPA